MEIYRVPNAGLITEKRQKVPYRIEHACDCGNYILYDFTKESYLNYVSVGEVDEFTVYCDCCEKETTVKIRFNVSLELVGEEENKDEE